MLETILAFIGGGFLGYLLKGTEDEPKGSICSPKEEPLSQRITDVIEVEQLKKELAEQQEKFKQLNREIEQSYIKDTCSFELNNCSKVVWLEYIEKFGNNSVKFYRFTPTYYSFGREFLIEYPEELCIPLRDFLLKHFPVKEEPNDKL